jgi:hypothetical protein
MTSSASSEKNPCTEAGDNYTGNQEDPERPKE